MARKGTEERREERRERIIRAARDVFSRKNYDEVTVADITAEAGIARGTLYLYFSGKENLFLEVIRDAVQRLRRRLGEALVDVDDPLERVRISVPVIFDACRREAGLYSTIFQRAVFLETGHEEEYDALYQPLAKDFQVTIEEGVRRGQFRTGDPEVISHGVFGFLAALIHHWLILEARGEVRGEYLEEVTSTVGRFFCYGLAGEPFPGLGEMERESRTFLREQLEEVRRERRRLERLEGLLASML
jgi:AcrR family transcriptional regulator